MNLDVFGVRYKSVSNLFTETVEGNSYVFPFPLNIYGTIENESKNTKNEIYFSFSSYYDSILILDCYFSVFFYLMDFSYKLTTVYIKNIIKTKTEQELNKYRGHYIFSNDDVVLNICESDLYDKYCKVKTNLQN